MLCQLLHERDEIAANGISEGDKEKRGDRFQHATREHEVEHIRNAMLKASKDKDHHAHENRNHAEKILLRNALFEGINGNKHQHAAEHAEDQKAIPTIPQLGCHHALTGRLQALAEAGQTNQNRRERRSDKVTDPNEQNGVKVTPLFLKQVLQNVSHHAREKVETEHKDRQEPYRKEERACKFVGLCQEYDAANADAKPCRNREDECVDRMLQ